MNSLHSVHRAATALLFLGVALLLWAMGQALYWGLDRSPPFELLHYRVTPARPGEAIVVRASVQRDLTRHCSVMYSRHFFDAGGIRYDLTLGDMLMNAPALDDLNRRMPNEMIFSIATPPSATPGKGAIVTALDYVCNPLHRLYPITLILTIDVDILPPLKGPP